jgi:hypothetical protein
MRWGVLSPENSGLRGSESRPAGPAANIGVKGQTDDSRITSLRRPRSRFAPRRTECPARKAGVADAVRPDPGHRDRRRARWSDQHLPLSNIGGSPSYRYGHLSRVPSPFPWRRGNRPPRNARAAGTADKIDSGDRLPVVFPPGGRWACFDRHGHERTPISAGHGPGSPVVNERLRFPFLSRYRSAPRHN